MPLLCASAWIEGVSTDRPVVTVRFWAGARRAAGHAQEQLAAATVAEVLEQLTAREAMVAILASASYLVDGVAADPATVLTTGALVDVLPPFAGG